MQAQGAVGPADGGQYIANYDSQAGPGWTRIFGFLDGVRGITDRAEAITGDVVGIRDQITGSNRVKWELERDQERFDQDQQLEFFKVERGDNRFVYLAVGGVALGAVLLLFGR